MNVTYDLTEANVAGQLEDIRATLDRLMTNVSGRQFNWQPDHGTKWSIGQCLDHLTKSADVYSTPIAEAISTARPSTSVARPNPLGRVFIWILEPPPRFKTSAQAIAQPASSFDVLRTRTEFERTLTALEALVARAVKVDSRRTKFANPFAGGRRLFNVCTGIMVLLAHARRHLLQAEKVKARPDFPSA